MLGGLALLLVLGVLAPAAAAHFRGASSASLTVGTASVAPPTDLAVTCTRNGNVLTATITWTGTSAATAYDVEHRLSTDTAWTDSGTVAAPTTSFTIDGLDRRLEYDVQVTAVVGSWSATSTTLRVANCA